MIIKENFGFYNNKPATLYVLKNEYLEIGISDFGGIIQKFIVKSQNMEKDIVCSAKSASDYVRHDAHMGGTIGRVANRIANGEFSLNGVTYHLDKNATGSTLHGGFNPYDYRFFNAEVENDILRLKLISDNLDQGFPGRLEFTVEFELVKNRLLIRFFGLSDADTLFNPTNHAYFNLAGEGSGNIYETELTIYGNEVTIADDNLVVTGEVLDVANTPFDFSKSKKIGKEIFSDDINIVSAGGYDHNYILNSNHVATAFSEASGIKLDIFSDYPGVQFYSGCQMKNIDGKSLYNKHEAFCLEPQYFPNAINIDKFDAPIIKAGTTVSHYIEYVVNVNK